MFLHCVLIVQFLSKSLLSFVSLLLCTFSSGCFEDFLITAFQQFDYEVPSYGFKKVYSDWDLMSFWICDFMVFNKFGETSAILHIFVFSPLLPFFGLPV